MDSEIVIVDVLPELLGTYGDFGNVAILAKRLHLFGFKVRILHATQSSGIPHNGDIYILGGGEDSPQAEAARILRDSRSLNIAHNKGALILGVCAGYQLLGNSFVAEGKIVGGLEIADIHSIRGVFRSVGELLVESELFGPEYLLSGFENHGGVTILGENVQSLGKVLFGKGNGPDPDMKQPPFEHFADRIKKYGNSIIKHIKRVNLGEFPGNLHDGIIADNVICTYMHGPVLARNYKLADYLISRIVPSTEPSELLSDLNEIGEKLRLERIGAVCKGKSI